MARSVGSGKTPCESTNNIDVRYLHRMGYLSDAFSLSLDWTRGGECLGSIDLQTAPDRVVLYYPVRDGGSSWKTVEQRVSVVWTPCRFGGKRPWFRCEGSAEGHDCGRRAAKLYNAGDQFACRRCCGLIYATQLETPLLRAISRARKIRMRLGGGANLAEPFPAKPKGMHWRTYQRLKAKACAAESYWSTQTIRSWERRLQQEGATA